MDKFKCDSCFHKKVCQESPAYGTVMEDCPSYINVEIDNSLQQLKAEILPLVQTVIELLDGYSPSVVFALKELDKIESKLSAV